jgi:ribonuclease PH
LLESNVWLDLDYHLDSRADVDMNVIKTSDDRYVEIQATGEEATYNGEELMALLAMADRGLEALWDAQKVALDKAE